MESDKHNTFMIGDIHVSPSHNQLMAFGRTIQLQPKAMAVLHYLATHQTRVIGNEELIEQLWQGRIVTHGSVQKSINALRSAISDLIGDQEVIAHYSKRGYQLKVEPHFVEANASVLPAIDTETTPSTTDNPIIDDSPADKKPSTNTFNDWKSKTRWMGVIAALLVITWLIYSSFTPLSLPLHKNHKTSFSGTSGYTNETGHQQHAEPNPDNEHVAYIREKFNPNHAGEADSELVIRDKAGKDWRIASTQGSWSTLAWSPAGQHLVAVEVIRREGLPPSPDFYEKPSYLYSFHIFSLDLVNNRLIEKQLLSQWQGRIYSVSWWDEQTLEFVAKQGASTNSERYRYVIEDQQLTMLDEMEGATNLIASAIKDKKTALASRHKNIVQIDFLNEHQIRTSRWKLDLSDVDISWMPDGSGVLIYAEEEHKLLILYVDGQQVEIPLNTTKDKVFSRPRYRPDGNAIFYTEKKRRSNIVLSSTDNTTKTITENTVLNYAATFSPSGEKIVYASVHNNQVHLWLVEAGQERQLTHQAIAQHADAIVWSENGEHLVFSAGTLLYDYDFLNGETSVLVNEPDKIQPLAYFPDAKKLLVIKTIGETKNLWRIDLKTKQQKQLTFGSVASAVEYDGNIYFQYASENGLWVMRNKDDSLQQVTQKLSANIELLKAEKNGVYFISGGSCRESDIDYFNYASELATTVLVRSNKAVISTSFNPNKGVLQTDCNPPDSNILVLE